MSGPVSFIECVSKMAYIRVLSCVMLALISSIIASIQLNHAIIDIQENYNSRMSVYFDWHDSQSTFFAAFDTL